MKKTTWAAIGLLLAAAILLILVLVVFPGKPAGSGSGAELLLDGAALPAAYLPGASEGTPAAGDLRVVISLDGRDVAVLPFGEAHTLKILQENGDENTLLLTEESVRMESANCEGQDCVHMEEVTRDNLETRVMYGMIICLPHRVTVEVK